MMMTVLRPLVRLNYSSQNSILIDATATATATAAKARQDETTQSQSCGQVSEHVKILWPEPQRKGGTGWPKSQELPAHAFLI